MRKLFGLALAVFMVLGFGISLRAEKAPAAAPVVDATQPTPAVVEEAVKPAEGEKKALEAIETSGVIEVAEPGEGEKHKKVTLKVGEIVYRLIPNKESVDMFKKLEEMAGKTVKVKGELLPANPPKYPLAAIKVAEFSE